MNLLSRLFALLAAGVLLFPPSPLLAQRSTLSTRAPKTSNAHPAASATRPQNKDLKSAVRTVTIKRKGVITRYKQRFNIHLKHPSAALKAQLASTTSSPLLPSSARPLTASSRQPPEPSTPSTAALPPPPSPPRPLVAPRSAASPSCRPSRTLRPQPIPPSPLPSPREPTSAFSPGPAAPRHAPHPLPSVQSSRDSSSMPFRLRTVPAISLIRSFFPALEPVRSSPSCSETSIGKGSS